MIKARLRFSFAVGLAAAAISSVSCVEGLNESTFVLAQGSQGEVLVTAGCPSKKDEIIEFDGARKTYTALTPGKTRVVCGATSVVFDVRKVEQIKIEGPAEANASRYSFYRVIAMDGAGASIVLGKDSPVEWIIPEGVERSTWCGDIVPICPGNASPKLRGKPGKHTVGAKFGGRETSFDVTFVEKL